MAPDLTVAICAYNAEKYIERTLEGFHRQTLRDFRLLVIDDCSTDATAKVVRAFIDARKWESASVVSLPRNVGLAGSRKYGEQHIETDFVLDFDADDIPLPEMLAKLTEVLRREPDCMGVGCYCDYIDDNDRKIPGGFYMGPKTKQEFDEKAAAMKLMFLHHPMVRRQVAAGAGGRATEGFPTGRIRYQDMCEDLDLWTRMSDLYAQGKYFKVLPETLFLYRKHANAMSTSSAAMNERMRHIKTNLRRRRAGLAELTFVDYVASLDAWRRFRNGIFDLSSDYYKQAGFFYLKRDYLRFALKLAGAAALSPSYVYQKLTSNFSTFSKR